MKETEMSDEDFEIVRKITQHAAHMADKVLNIVQDEAEKSGYKNRDFFNFNTLTMAAAFAILIRSQYDYTENVTLEEYKSHCLSGVESFLKEVKDMSIKEKMN